MNDLTKAETHFEFGKNWRSYARQVTPKEIDEATAGMQRLLRMADLHGRSVLDIGCGSGLHALVAARLGASQVIALDIDADSVTTARELIDAHVPGHTVSVQHASILDCPLPEQGFDIVYSWGVLHHTGNLDGALRRAASAVRRGGLLAVALYRRTLLCPLWRMEKRWYRDADEASRRRAREAYSYAVRIGLALTGRRYEDFVLQYPVANRGMDFDHDVHDWLGGYPYESISPGRVSRVLRAMGFVKEWENVRRDPFALSGALGSGCDEYLFHRLEQ